MKKLFASIAVVFALLTLAPAGMGSAYTIIPKSDCAGDAGNSAVCQSRNNKTNPLTGANGLLLKLATIIAIISGAAAVIIIVLAGLRLVQSGGSSEDIAGARRSIIYALVGLVVIVIARILIGIALSAI